MSNLKAIKVNAERSVAYDSPDHLVPWGTSRDNSKNNYFNEKLYDLFGDLEHPLRVLDLGCSGGGFIRECLNDGCLAVGLEGSDFSLRMSRAEWAYLGGKFLFTADITKKFDVIGVNEDAREHQIKFDVITSWDVLEHIKEDDLLHVCKNLSKNLSDDGLCIFSISNSSDIIRGVELHQTIKPKQWWIDLFQKNDFVFRPEYEDYFNSQYIRGIKQNAPYSFHLILSKKRANPPIPPKLGLKQIILDKWRYSKLHKYINSFFWIH